MELHVTSEDGQVRAGAEDVHIKPIGRKGGLLSSFQTTRTQVSTVGRS